jgi:hypothetical protein
MPLDHKHFQGLSALRKGKTDSLISEYFRESIRHEIRTARERFSGQDLSLELGRIQKRLDTVELLSPDIIMNLLLSYRDVQVGLAMGVRDRDLDHVH